MLSPINARPVGPGGNETMSMVASDALILEANHRIANSLQLLSALLSSESREIRDPLAKEALETSVQRIAAIAGVHRQLYLSAGRDGLDLAAYLLDLIEGLRDSLVGDAKHRHIRLEVGPARVPGQFASMLGVVVTELVINALKHAYATEQAGCIDVSLSICEARRFSLEVRDAGIGRPAHCGGANGFGSRIVELAVRSCGAEGGYRERRQGTSFVMTGALPKV